MATTQTAIKKLVEETKSGDFFIASDEPVIEVIREGGKQNKLVEKDNVFWSFCKTTYEGEDAIRMVFALREGNKKVLNVNKQMKIIEELEAVLIYIDRCLTSNSDGFMYVDAIKIL
jgi:hypothetical protein